MIHLTIETTSHCISIFDLENHGRRYDFRKPEKILHHEVYRLFMDLAIKTWMNQTTLKALKDEIMKAYPTIKVDWNYIFQSVDAMFEFKEIKSNHVKLETQAYSPYTLG
ncbi:MAG: hypothetical protein ABI091_15565 [Ferruginibacter sp.]